MLRRLFLFAVLVVTLAVPASASAAESGSISGTVSNGTPGGGSVAGLTVTLSRFQGMDSVQDYTTKTDDKGAFSFKDLPINEGEAYIARVTYLDVVYAGTMELLTDNPTATSDIKVYETTTDPSSIAIVSRGIVVAGADPSQRLVNLFEILAVDNNTKRTYLGNNGEVLRLPLPDGTAQITPQPGFDFGNARIDKAQLVTTGPIPPGQQNAMIAYSVPYTGTSKTITLGTAMPTQSLRFLVREGTYTISSPALNDTGTVDVSGDQYHVLSVDKPIVGDTVSVQVTGLPKAGTSGDSSRGPIYAAIAAVVGLLAAGFLVYQTLRRRRAAPAVEPAAAAAAAATTGNGFEDQRLALAAQLNDLDERRAAGRLDEAEYEEGRQAVLAELRSVSRRMRGLEMEDVEA